MEFNQLKEFIKSESYCKLISCSYKNVDSLMVLQCSCGEDFEVSFRNFKYENKRLCDSCKKDLDFLTKGKISKEEHVKDFLASKSPNIELIKVKNLNTEKTSLIEMRCHCGKHFENSIVNLKQNKVIQCNYCKANVFRMNVTNLEVEGIKVLNFESYKNEESVLDFVCRCGNIFSRSVRSFVLNKKRCLECASEDLSRSQRLDFGYVNSLVKETGCMLLSGEKDYINQYSELRFKCKCGESFSRSLSNFRRREPKCLSCSQSYGEYQVEKYLNSCNLDFKKEFFFDDLRGDCNPLRFDFAVFTDNKTTLIEYDGEFHYKPIVSNDSLSKQKRYDILKDEYCKRNNIKLIRIPYWEFNNISKILQIEFKKSLVC